LATSEAKSLSDSACEKLKSSNQTIQLSMESFSEMIVLIDHLGTHITSFASAMEQVKRVSQTIDTIARTTNMLALNAAIEAEKAGDAGVTFAVVAGEVKKLALDTRAAAVEITGTVNSLSDEASKFVGQIEAGMASSNAAQRQYANLQSMLAGVTEIVGHVGEYNQEIANSTAAIHRSLSESQSVRADVDTANSRMHTLLEGAHTQINGLEIEASRMFDHIVHSGLSHDDMQFVEMARSEAARFTELTESAIACGQLSVEALFDSNFVPIAGSNPKRFTTGLSTWADTHWRPELDQIKRKNNKILTVNCSSDKGFLPTHISEFSRAPTGDLMHDTKYCRNGRILFEGVDIPAKASEQDYMMAVYRQEGDGKTYYTVRNVYVPLRINGRRWGDFEIAYIL
jgi:methyl-accepting chemotaxis protein